MRSPDEFSGKILAPAHLPQEQSQRPGHIPTAINVPWSKAANEDGTFKSDDDLRELYGEAGLDGSRPTIAYCRIGERSSHTWFVLRELLGHSDVKNYDGSWTEYGSLIGVPIELGAAEGSELMCGAPDQAVALPAGTDLTKETVLAGRVLAERVSRSAARSSGCWTARASSPPRSSPRRRATSGSSPRPAPGRCGRCRARATARPCVTAEGPGLHTTELAVA